MMFKDARTKAHRMATKDNAAMAILREEGQNYIVTLAGSSRVGEKGILYIAQPNTVPYQEYAEAARSRNEAVMSEADWKQAGSLSYQDLMIKWFGKAKADQISAKSKHAPSKRDAKVVVSGKETPAGEKPTRGKTRQVWDIADSLVVDGIAAKRAAIIEACVAAGINAATAATQYAAWVRANKEEK